VSLAKYLKVAFLNRWNLLFFLGGMGFAIVSGKPEFFAPLVLAGEVTYVGLLGTHTRFQSYVDAQAAKATRQDGSDGTQKTLGRILGSLPQRSLQRFEALRERCVELRQLALEIKDPGGVITAPPLDSLQLAGLDRLLWIFLRLLYTQHSLDRFLEKTSADQIQKEVDRIEGRLKQVPASPEDLQSQKVRKALEDNLETCKARLVNFEKARDNSELVGLEIDRLENKIRSLSELAVNRQEPDFISGQVDQVASSMINTEKTMSELEFVTGIDSADDKIPELVRRPMLKATE
jgi:hypothetical protein